MEELLRRTPRALVVDDDADSWGMERWHYRDIDGEFAPVPGSFRTVESGPVRTIREAAYAYKRSTLVIQTVSYTSFPFLEFRLRILWNEERKRLKLSIPTRIHFASVLCEIPGGAIRRPADGEEHTHGRWMILSGEVEGRHASIAIVNSGQHGLDVLNGEVRLSVLRSAPYCYERTFSLDKHPQRKVMDLGVHDVRLLVAVGDEQELLTQVTGLADWLSAPPFALAHYPIGAGTRARQELFTLEPASLRLLACKQSWDGQALVIRLHETMGTSTSGVLTLHHPAVTISSSFAPFEIKTFRIEKDGEWRAVRMIEEE
jgi:alpha-mannosidase